MLDFDLAVLYKIETKVLKQAVKRNIKRFEGDDFMFELTWEEYNFLRSQIVTLENQGRGKYSKYLPFAFTELGIAMLSSVLKSDVAIEVNRSIMRAFVAMCQMILMPPNIEIKELQSQFKEFKQYIEAAFTDYNDINADTMVQIELINEALAELQAKNKKQNNVRNPIGYVKPQKP